MAASKGKDQSDDLARAISVARYCFPAIRTGELLIRCLQHRATTTVPQDLVLMLTHIDDKSLASAVLAYADANKPQLLQA